MNYIVSRQFYNEHIKEVKEFKSIYIGNVDKDDNKLISFIKSFELIGTTFYHYYWNSTYNCFFQYFLGIQRIIVDANLVDKIDPEAIVKEEVELRDWKVILDPDQTRNPLYTLNVFRRFSSGSSIRYGLWQTTTIKDGAQYKNITLINSVTKEEIKVSTYLEELEYSEDIYLAFPELHQYPINVKECRIKTSFIYDLMLYLYDKQRSQTTA